MANRKISQFAEATSLTDNAMIPIIQGNPLDDMIISKDNFKSYMLAGIVTGNTTGGTIDTSNLVPYTGATQEVNLGNFSISADSVKIDTVTPVVLSQPGQIGWNSVDGTFDMRLLNNTTLQAGQELYFYGKAQGAIQNGDVVQFAGVQGDHFLIRKAVPSEVNLHPEYLMGIATDLISNNQYGYVTSFGKINGIYTTGWTLESPVLYFDFVNGGLTNVEPQAPTRRIILASVVKLQTGNAENGIIFVRPSLGCKLTDLDDVNGTPLTTTGQIMVWDDIRGVFDFTYNINNYISKSYIEIEASYTTASYTLQNNKQTLITGTLPNGVNSTIILPNIISGQLNESILHFKTNATAPPTLVYSGFTPIWLNGNAISMKVNKQYTIVFEQINGIVKTSWGEY